MRSLNVSLTTAIVEPGATVLPNAEERRQRGANALVDALLADQGDLSAVERFSQLHDSIDTDLIDTAAQAKYYRSLLPVSRPRQGQQYAFEVDLDRCSGCKSCVAACHSLNGLDEHETWREVGLLHGGTAELPILQHATTACHHCLEPACLSACPVRAYEKHPETGIVQHLDDQCIGCQYCMFACPYDVPKYNARLGIVRKCDMCSQRLAVDEAPACVQACPHEAIRISLVTHQEIVANCETNSFLPGAPEPTITFPATNYKTARALPRNLLPADYHSVKREHAHWPLIVMLVLTQLSVGGFLIDFVMRMVQGVGTLAAARSATALAFAVIAMAASVFHLGRPRFAYRAILGLRTSWLSREILAFTLFTGVAVAYSALTFFRARQNPQAMEIFLGVGVAGFGLAGIACSVMVYAVTRRTFWNASSTALKFLLTTTVLGAAATLATSLAAAVWPGATSSGDVMDAYGQPLCLLLVVSMAAKLVVEGAVFRHLRQKQASALRRSAELMRGELVAVVQSRFICGFVGGIALPCMLLQIGFAPPDNSRLLIGLVAIALFAACLAGELLERYLFFTAVSQPKMPGGVGG
jgi:formate dehydrogenase iron-sulfur subunit